MGQKVNYGFMKGIFMVLKFHVFYLQDILEMYLCITLNRKAE